VALEGGGGAMQAALDVDEGVRAATVAATAIIALARASAFHLMASFRVQSLEVGAHPHQFFTCHGRQYSAGSRRL
jgi:hypothetical protein